MTTGTARAVTILALLAGAAIPAIDAAAPSHVLVVCSPGSPGTTAQAQPTMDLFARAVEAAAKRPAESLAAVYYESAETGIPRLEQADAVLAMVPLPFLIQYGAKLGLEPRLEAQPEPAATEVWFLAARKGAVSSATALTGWEVTGAPGYSPDFVRRTILSDWGALPDDVRITFTPRVLAALRRAASGEKVAVILDRSQEAALASLPFAADLEVLAHSRPLPSGYLCAVGKRLGAADLDAYTQALLKLHENASGQAVLKEMRMHRFVPVDLKSLDAIRARTAGASGAGR